MEVASKSQIRNEMRIRLKDLSGSSSKTPPCLSFFKSPQILLYASRAQEFPTEAIFKLFSADKRSIFFPDLLNERIIFKRVREWKELKKDSFFDRPTDDEGWISKPYSSTLAIIPGLAFSQNGVRLGSGKGHYDRFLSQHPEIIRLGLCFDLQLLPVLPCESHDQPMDFIATPSGLWGSPRAELGSLW